MHASDIKQFNGKVVEIETVAGAKIIAQIRAVDAEGILLGIPDSARMHNPPGMKCSKVASVRLVGDSSS